MTSWQSDCYYWLSITNWYQIGAESHISEHYGVAYDSTLNHWFRAATTEDNLPRFLFFFCPPLDGWGKVPNVLGRQ